MFRATGLSLITVRSLFYEVHDDEADFFIMTQVLYRARDGSAGQTGKMAVNLYCFVRNHPRWA